MALGPILGYLVGMVIIRPTASLARRMRVKTPSAASATSTTRLGDWYAVDLVLARRQFILAVNSGSRIAAVVPAAPYASFPERLPAAVREILSAMQVSPENIRAEIAEMSEFTLAKTDNRSIVGTMNDYRKHLELMVGIGRLNIHSPIDMSLRMCGTPSLVMPGTWPQDVTLTLFEQPPAVHKVGNPFQPPKLVLIK